MELLAFGNQASFFGAFRHYVPCGTDIVKLQKATIGLHLLPTQEATLFFVLFLQSQHKSGFCHLDANAVLQHSQII